MEIHMFINITNQKLREIRFVFTEMIKKFLKSNFQKNYQKQLFFFKTCLDIEVKDETSSISSGLFYLESQLEDFLIQNWAETEFGQKYNLIYEGGDLKSQQYRTDIGRIDILAKNKSNDSYVVIELKRNQTSDDTVGQVTRYVGWIQDLSLIHI